MKIILKYDEVKINGAEVQLDNVILPSIVRWVQNEKEKVAACNFKTGVATYWAYKYETKAGTKVVNIDIESISKDEDNGLKGDFDRDKFANDFEEEHGWCPDAGYDEIKRNK